MNKTMCKSFEKSYHYIVNNLGYVKPSCRATPRFKLAWRTHLQRLFLTADTFAFQIKSYTSNRKIFHIDI